MDLRDYIRDVPDFPQPGILFRDITPLLREPAAFAHALDALCEAVAGATSGGVAPLTIVGIESRGFIFGAPVAARLGLPFVPVRKPGKLPAARMSIEYSLEYGASQLDIHADAIAPGGRAVIFAPNRLFPFETHGHYWNGVYHFGNTPLINYLPDLIRNQLAPHVRAYTAEGLRSLFLGLPVRVVKHTQIYPGYDNVVYRRPALGRVLRRITYALEHSPLTVFGISHLLVLEKS